ncbi:MAG TPA: purine-nucleoside phosphorylase [Bdellovibrionota bacterium]|nr:purine-nucleoside phosphorylase [Bdellovibrionota bacterium]
MQQTVYQKIRDAVESIQSKTALKPEIGVILGSGLGSVADQATESVAIPYTDIPHFHGTTIEGHAGRMVVGRFHGVPTVFLQGRFHLYEGYPMEDVAFPTRTVCGLGIHTLVLTNAAGGVNPSFQPGDLMLIKDHLNLMGDNPLKGPNLAQLGPRFPDLTEAYAKDCVEILQKSAREIKIEVHQGIYAGLLGPTYETPAEIRMYRTLGADAVGMSTVPEAIVANHLGVRVAGISYISNLAAGLSPQKLTHQEVIENSKIGADKLKSLLQLAIPRLGENKVKS